MKGKAMPMFNPIVNIKIELGSQVRMWLFRKLFGWIVNTPPDELPSDMAAFYSMVLEGATWEDWYRWGKDA